MKNIRKKVDVQRKIENANIIVSNQCRMLLRNDFDLHKSWVNKAYRKLNAAMEKEDCEEVESIGYAASNRMMEVTSE